MKKKQQQIKSMAEHLAKVDKIRSSRKSRFPGQYTEDVQSVVFMIIRDITDRYLKVGAATGEGRNVPACQLSFGYHGDLSVAMDLGFRTST